LIGGSNASKIKSSIQIYEGYLRRLGSCWWQKTIKESSLRICKGAESKGLAQEEINRHRRFIGASFEKS